MIKEYIDNYLREFHYYKPNSCWCYEDGIILSGASYLYLATKEEKYLNFILNYLDIQIAEDGTPHHYDLEDYNIDDINSGKVLFFALKYAPKEKYQNAINLLYKQLETHPRTHVGNFFHKKRYPFQIWMDGLYMAQPFYNKYVQFISKDYSKLDDILNQFQNVRKYLFDEKRKLYIHAYDENKVMQWSDKSTGQAPNAWSRAVGWYAMAIVDIVEDLDPVRDQKMITELKKIYLEMIEGMLQYQDPKSKMWYQVIDKAEVAGNYLETSGSAMVCYSLLKGARLNFIESKYAKIGVDCYHGITSNMLYQKDGKVHLKNICQVAGLDNEKRNGSVEYYLSEKIVEDEAKGVAPFMMATAEMILRKEKIN